MFILSLVMAILSYVMGIVLTGIMTDFPALKHDWYMLPITLFWPITWLIRLYKHYRGI